MNTYRCHTYTYTAILEDGETIRLGTASSETDDNGGTLRSQFGSSRAEVSFCFEDDDFTAPAGLVRIVQPEEVSRFWSADAAAPALHKMLSLCAVPAEAVIGFIVTQEQEDNWDTHGPETKIIVKPGYSV